MRKVFFALAIAAVFLTGCGYRLVNTNNDPAYQQSQNGYQSGGNGQAQPSGQVSQPAPQVQGNPQGNPQGQTQQPSTGQAGQSGGVQPPPPPPPAAAVAPAQQAQSGNGIPQDTRGDLALAPGIGGCPTEQSVQSTLGLKVHWVGGCAFKWNSDSKPNSDPFVVAPCPSGWRCTLDQGPQNYAWNGDGQSKRFEAGTFFPLGSVTFGSDCAYLSHENVYASLVNVPPTLSGNLNLNCTTTSSSASPGGQQPAGSSTTSGGCFIFGGVQTHSIDNGACKLDHQPSPVTGAVPSGFTADYWKSASQPNATAQPGETITADEITFHPK